MLAQAWQERDRLSGPLCWAGPGCTALWWAAHCPPCAALTRCCIRTTLHTACCTHLHCAAPWPSILQYSLAQARRPIGFHGPQVAPASESLPEGPRWTALKQARLPALRRSWAGPPKLHRRSLVSTSFARALSSVFPCAAPRPDQTRAWPPGAHEGRGSKTIKSEKHTRQRLNRRLDDTTRKGEQESDGRTDGEGGRKRPPQLPRSQRDKPSKARPAPWEGGICPATAAGTASRLCRNPRHCHRLCNTESTGFQQKLGTAVSWPAMAYEQSQLAPWMHQVPASRKVAQPLPTRLWPKSPIRLGLKGV